MSRGYVYGYMTSESIGVVGSVDLTILSYHHMYSRLDVYMYSPLDVHIYNINKNRVVTADSLVINEQCISPFPYLWITRSAFARA